MVRTLLKLAFSGGLIYWLIQRGSLDLSILWQLTHPLQLTLLLGLYLCLMLNNNLRWCVLLKALEVKATFKETFKLSLVGLFFNFAMPGGVGGDLVKGYYLLKNQKNKKVEAAMSIFFDRFAGLYTMVIVGSLTLLFYIFNTSHHPYQTQLNGLLWSVILILLALSFILALCFSPQFYHLCQKFLSYLPWSLFNTEEGLGTLKFSYFFKAMGLSFLTLMICISFFYASATFTGFVLPFWIYLYAVPLGFVCMALPVSPGGIGIGQVAALALFSWGLGQETQVGPTVISAFQLIGILWGLVGAVIYLYIKQNLKGDMV